MTINVLDAGPLGLLTRRGGVAEVDACKRWLRDACARGVRVIVPEIADYEVRRELLRAGKVQGQARLDRLVEALEYLPLNTVALRKAAELWAESRRRGRPTADAQALDCDVILAAQALTSFGAEAVVVTSNVGHLSQFLSTADWAQIVG